jgi:hypothetical protein
LALVLKLWLKNVPEYVVAFTRILLINSFIDSMGSPLASALHATGKVKSFQVISGIIFIGNLPVSLVALLFGFSAVSVQVIGVILSVSVFFARLFILARQIQFSIWYYIKSVLIPSIIVCIIGSIIPVLFVWIYPEGIKRLFLTVITSTVSIMLTILFLGISSSERLIVIRKVKSHIPFYKNKG